MQIFNRLTGAFHAVVRRKHADAQFDEELSEYLAASIGAKVASGLSHAEARREALAEFGSTAAVKEWVRDAGWESRLESISQDIQYALRILRRSPGFAAVAILMFALGIGANLSVFSVIDAALLKPLPFQEADRLVEIFDVLRPGTAEETIYSSIHRARAEQWRTQTGIFDAVELENGPYPKALGDTGETIRVAQVSAGVFPLLGLSPVLGRHFSAEESASGDPRVLLISHGLWKRLGATRDIVGRELLLAKRTVTIIGVMPREARFPVSRPVDAWQPLTNVINPKERTSYLVRPIARLREGLTPATAQAEIARAATAMQRVAPDREPWTAKVETIDPRQWRRRALPVVLIVFGAVAIVLLTACANIANLLLARTSARQREMAIRGALGASRGRLTRQLLIESLVLAAGGGIGAIALASWVIPIIPALLPPGFVGLDIHDVQLDSRVLAAAIAASCVAAALSGILPALRGSQHATVALTTGRGVTAAPVQRRTRNSLVAAQMALASVLLVGAGLVTSSLVRIITSDPGFRLDGLLQVTLELPGKEYQSAAPRDRFFRDLADSVRASGAVSSVTFGTAPPNEGSGALTSEDHRNRPETRAGAAVLAAGPDYFSALGIPIVSGRPLSADDQDSAQVAVIDEETARRFWPGESAIGKRLRYGPYSPWKTVVGVAKDVKTSRIGSTETSFEVYVPARQVSWAPTIMFRATTDKDSALATVVGRMKALEPKAKVTSGGAVSDLYDPSLTNPRFTAAAMSSFAILALVTAAIGLYGMLAYAVSRRTSEIGVRMALGASSSNVRRLIVTEALSPVAAGLIVGIAAAQALSRVIAAQLYQTKPYDPLTLTAVIVVFAAVAMIAAYLPARRATRVDPVVALRAE